MYYTLIYARICHGKFDTHCEHSLYQRRISSSWVPEAVHFWGPLTYKRVQSFFAPYQQLQFLVQVFLCFFITTSLSNEELDDYLIIWIRQVIFESINTINYSLFSKAFYYSKALWFLFTLQTFDVSFPKMIFLAEAPHGAPKARGFDAVPHLARAKSNTILYTIQKRKNQTKYHIILCKGRISFEIKNIHLARNID